MDVVVVKHDFPVQICTFHTIPSKTNYELDPHPLHHYPYGMEGWWTRHISIDLDISFNSKQHFFFKMTSSVHPLPNHTPRDEGLWMITFLLQIWTFLSIHNKNIFVIDSNLPSIPTWWEKGHWTWQITVALDISSNSNQKEIFINWAFTHLCPYPHVVWDYERWLLCGARHFFFNS